MFDFCTYWWYSSQLTCIFFRGVGQPPTTYESWKLLCYSSTFAARLSWAARAATGDGNLQRWSGELTMQQVPPWGSNRVTMVSSPTMSPWWLSSLGELPVEPDRLAVPWLGSLVVPCFCAMWTQSVSERRTWLLILWRPSFRNSCARCWLVFFRHGPPRCQNLV